MDEVWTSFKSQHGVTQELKLESHGSGVEGRLGLEHQT